MINIGFSGPFDISNWTQSVNASVPSLWNISNVPNSVTLNTDIHWMNSSNSMSINAPSAGTVSFAWTGTSNYADCPISYFINGAYTYLNSAGTDSGICISFKVNKGDNFGFQVGLTQNMSSDAFNATIFNFVFSS